MFKCRNKQHVGESERVWLIATPGSNPARACIKCALHSVRRGLNAKNGPRILSDSEVYELNLGDPNE